MARSDVIRADLERVSGYSDEEFEQLWGDWARRYDRDLSMMRQRWIADLDYQLDYAEREEAAVAELVAAKQAYRDDPSEANRQAKADAVVAVQQIRAEERDRADRGPKDFRIGGDAYVERI